VPWPAHSAATTTAGARALCREDHLQQLVWVFEEIFEFVALRAQYLLRELRRHLDAATEESSAT